MKRFHEWLSSKWQHPQDTEQAKRDYERALCQIFGTPSGRFVLNRWMDSVYCSVSYVPNGRCCDTAFNEGQRAFLQGVLEAMDRQEHPQGETVIEVE